MKKEKKPDVKIETASEDDWPAIKKIIEENKDTLVQDDLPSWNEFFVARHESGIVGCAALVIYTKRLAELRTLAVAEAYKKNGIAPELVYACISKAQKAGVKDVLAISGNKDFFEKLNFSTFKDEKYALFRKTNPMEIPHLCVSCKRTMTIKQGMTSIVGVWACTECIKKILEKS